MPGMDGIGLIRLVRKHEVLKRLPVVLISAREAQPANVLDLLQEGADAYLKKPIKADVLSMLWQLVLNKRKQNALVDEVSRQQAIIR